MANKRSSNGHRARRSISFDPELLALLEQRLKRIGEKNFSAYVCRAMRANLKRPDLAQVEVPL